MRLYGLVGALCLCVPIVNAGGYFDMETGLVFGGYNDVRIPPDAGTEFSLTDDLDTDANRFVRLRAGMSLGERHELSFLFAPLRLYAEGVITRAIHYRDHDYAAGTRLEARYRVDSYRLTWRYALWRSARIDFDLGLTAKLRDAEILLEGDDARTAEENTGFVPLLSFGFRWHVRNGLDMILDGDALASPGGEGRAEDLLAAVQWQVRPQTGLRLGYRFLEGGADVEDVYNFALIHYLSLGVYIEL